MYSTAQETYNKIRKTNSISYLQHHEPTRNQVGSQYMWHSLLIEKDAVKAQTQQFLLELDVFPIAYIPKLRNWTKKSHFVNVMDTRSW